MNRSTSLVLAGLAAAGLLAGCGENQASATPAATINGNEISSRNLVDELEAIEGNAEYIGALEQQATANSQPPIVAADGEFSTAFVRETLGVRIQYALVTDEVDERGLVAGDDCVAEAADQLIAGYADASTTGDGQAVFDAFSEGYRDYLLERQTDLLVLVADVAGVECGAEVTEEDAAAYLDAHPELAAETACSSHILVATAEEAAEIANLLDEGADFSTLAQERSSDSGSAAQGGALGCGPPGQFTEAFDAAVFAQPVGEPGDPVQTEFGHHVILVTERGVPSFEELRPDIDAAIVEEQRNEFSAWFQTALAEGEVTVDPRFGTWDATQGAIVPPAVEVTDAGEE